MKKIFPKIIKFISKFHPHRNPIWKKILEIKNSFIGKKNKLKKYVVVIFALCLFAFGFVLTQKGVALVQNFLADKTSQTEYDPMWIIKGKSSISLVDIRSENSYQKEHIRYAISIPVSIDSSGAIHDEARVLSDFKKLSSNRPIVIYGENQFSLTPHVLSEFLRKNGVQTKKLTVGWNEFRHLSNFWIPESMWNDIDVMLFVEGELVQ